MANEAVAYEAPRAPSRIAEAFFVGFLLLAFVGLTPFSPPPPQVASFGGVAGTGAGDLARQLCYLGVFAAIVAVAFLRNGVDSFLTLPVTLVLVLVWCLASALWSPEPGVSIRRGGLAVVLVFSAMLSVETVGTERSLTLWRWVLLAVLVVNLVSIRFIPEAVHLPGESDAQLVGDWRGLYGHKNIAGSVGAMTAILFLFAPCRTPLRKLFDIAVAAAAIGFTVMTRSKSSLGLLVVALVAGAAYRLAWKREIDRSIALVAGTLMTVAVAVFVIADQAAILRLFSDPTEFTGRTEIWGAELAFIRDHLALGSGFGTFSDTGGVSPLHAYIGGWVVEASHGHNGYLQILVTTGAVGFALALGAFVISPAVSFWKCGAPEFKAGLFALFVFLLAHNLMETDFLEGDGVTWVAFLLLLGMPGNFKREVEP